MKFEMSMTDTKTGRKWKQEIEAEEVKFPGFEEFTFALHSGYGAECLDYFVSEVSTGLRLFKDGFIRKTDARREGKVILQHLGTDGMRRAIKKAKAEEEKIAS